MLGKLWGRPPEVGGCRNFRICTGEQCTSRILLGLSLIPATTGRFLAGHHRGFVWRVEGVLPLAWPELWWPEFTGPDGKLRKRVDRASGRFSEVSGHFPAESRPYL